MNTKQEETEPFEAIVNMVREHDRKLRSMKIKAGIRNTKKQREFETWKNDMIAGADRVEEQEKETLNCTP